VEVAQCIAEHASLEQALARVVDGREDRVAGEGEDGGVGVQRAQAPERELRQAKAHLRQHQHHGQPQTDQRRDHTPDGRRERELTHDGVVVTELLDLGGHSASRHRKTHAVRGFGDFLAMSRAAAQVLRTGENSALRLALLAAVGPATRG
jgi:hypothetical protein